MSTKEFLILRFLCEYRGAVTQRLIAEETGLSLGTVNRKLAAFQEAGLVDESYQVTAKCIETMAPYRVDNAIIFASGISAGFIPISYELPKGLVSVKGEVMIERLIRQLQDAGIRQIVVVVGYMMEKFFYLRDKFRVKIVVNNEFAAAHNHSSIYVSRDYLSSTYLCFADNYYPKNLFHQYEEHAFCSAVYMDGDSYHERGIRANAEGRVISASKPAHDQWIMYGHAYFDRGFTRAFRPLLFGYFSGEDTENINWKTIFAEHVAELPMWISKRERGEILEFNSLEELAAYDADYLRENDIRVIDNICTTLHCSSGDIQGIEAMNQGLNNLSFKFRIGERAYIYRHPGQNASGVIDRRKEAASLRAAKRLGIDETIVFIDEEEGWKISEFVETTEAFDFSNARHIEMLAQKLKRLHESGTSVGFGFDYRTEADAIIDIQKRIDVLAYRALTAEREAMAPIFDYLDRDRWQVSLCHNDLYEPNLLVEGDRLHIIDWEFAGDADIGYDICKLFAVTLPAYDEIDGWTMPYYGRALTAEEKLHLIACAAVIYYYWYVWSIYALNNDEDVSDYMLVWFEKMERYRDMARTLMKEGK